MVAKSKAINYRLLVVVLLLVSLLGVYNPVTANAVSNPYILLDSDKGVDSVVESVNSKSQSFPDYGFKLLIQDKKDPKKVEIDKVNYQKLSTEDKKELMKQTFTEVENSSMGGRDRSRLYNFIEEQDEGTASAVRHLSTNVTTDFVSANEIFRPFTSPISTFLGLACIVIFFMLAIAITVDICFLSIPMFQAFVMRNDKDRPSYISQEAWDSLLIAESNLGTGDYSLWGTYLKNRTKTMVLVGLTLGYLIAGQMFDLAIFIVDVFTNALS
ncbi:hypothetical protein P4493_04445 [Bacillus thuringiensis]|jgi:hypothetical protein|uniref:Uncharacterized protein n=3 Tax=Bacillus thuringiensis TaxID=1428 RepID=A0A0B5N8B0_BACTU|nr:MULTISPECIES: hypothetical protein [Bacillus]EAO56988.1 hypothetical protein RBTH_07731 [Bacillus thuringiensis serovar israelensis ATCC 35646]MEC2534458.1 hypothetical protein [Bacillus cereus]MED1153759.1 hypothetical protein [Bacillus paranthracis]OUB09376.1 hypothetical protein BK708_33170 [Bacillus thuringiensis serovar yunnanensis]AFQ30073.1 hypothetical protein BTF1_29862 [Bacillus thuringiensis HD-789]